MFVVRSKTSQVCLWTLQHEYPGKGRYWGHGRRLSCSCHPQELELPTLLHTRCEFYNFELERRISLFRIGMLSFILRVGMSSLNRFRAGAVGFYWLVFFSFIFESSDWQSNVVYPEWLNPALVWGECFSDVLLVSMDLRPNVLIQLRL